jgi:hypothetical protein
MARGTIPAFGGWAPNSADGLAAARHARMAVAEIAKLIRTTCAGIVQTYIANPSKRGPSLAIFNWTRQMGPLRRCVGTVWWKWMG